MTLKRECAGSRFRSMIGPPLVIAHRGASLWNPENTLIAFQQAFHLGANAIELDVRLTLDGRVVVIHDATVDRTTNGSGLVSQMTLEQLKLLDAGFRFETAGNTPYPFREQSITIPTLEEVLEAFPERLILIELKDDNLALVDGVVELIKRYDAFDRVVIQTIGVSHRIARRLRSQDQCLKTGHSVFEIGLFYLLSKLRLTRLFKPRAMSFEVPRRKLLASFVSRRFVECAHERGIKVYLWTIDDQATIDRCLSLHVDGVITNDVRLVQERIKASADFKDRDQTRSPSSISN